VSLAAIRVPEESIANRASPRMYLMGGLLP
jgi:hypothetical protein